MSRLRDSDEFIRGAAREKLVAAWLQERGWHVIPSYDYAGSDGEKAPKLQGFREGHPVPDLDVARGGVRKWVEVKSKSYSPFWGKGQCHVHGIDLPLLQHYQTVEQITGTDCWIAIYEEDTGSLLCQSLSELGKPMSTGTDGRGKRIAYWRRDSFLLLHAFDPSATGDRTT
jgi:hypothetical protein